MNKIMDDVVTSAANKKENLDVFFKLNYNSQLADE